MEVILVSRVHLKAKDVSDKYHLVPTPQLSMATVPVFCLLLLTLAVSVIIHFRLRELLAIPFTGTNVSAK